MIIVSHKKQEWPLDIPRKSKEKIPALKSQRISLGKGELPAFGQMITVEKLRQFFVPIEKGESGLISRELPEPVTPLHRTASKSHKERLTSLLRKQEQGFLILPSSPQGLGASVSFLSKGKDSKISSPEIREHSPGDHRQGEDPVLRTFQFRKQGLQFLAFYGKSVGSRQREQPRRTSLTPNPLGRLPIALFSGHTA
jgi:hypothetical protein